MDRLESGGFSRRSRPGFARREALGEIAAVVTRAIAALEDRIGTRL
jgi:hypothetical protein